MNAPIRLLSIVPFPLFPPQSGGQQRALQLQKSLARFAEVTCITSKCSQPFQKDRLHVHPFLRAGVVRYIDFWRLRALFPKVHAAHLLVVDQPFWGLLAVLLAKRAGKPLVLHAHNIEFLRFKSMGKFWWKALYYYEKWVFRQASLAIFIADEDRGLAIKAFKIPKTKTWVFPYTLHPKGVVGSRNVLRKEISAKYGLPEHSPMVVFFGAFDYHPNLQALQILATEIAPRLQKLAPYAHIIVFGKGVPASFSAKYLAAPNNLKYIGYVDDITTIVAAADAMVNPVLTGGGVKTKVLESLALGIPVVSTVTGALGVEKDLCGDRLHLFPDGDWETCAQLLVKSLQAKGKLPDGFQQYYDPIAAMDRLWEGAIRKLLHM